MKTLAAPAAVDEFSGARLQAREAVGLDGAGLAQPSRQRLSPLTGRLSLPEIRFFLKSLLLQPANE